VGKRIAHLEEARLTFICHEQHYTAESSGGAVCLSHLRLGSRLPYKGHFNALVFDLQASLTAKAQGAIFWYN
jgi:hypothetical protein